MTHWRHSITLRLSLAFALLATLVFAALGAYLSRSADAHMAELDAHELLGKLALARNVGSRESSPAALAARLGDALVGEHGVIVAVDGENGRNFPLAGGRCSAAAWPPRPAASARHRVAWRSATAISASSPAPCKPPGAKRRASSSPATSATTPIFSTSCSVISGWRWLAAALPTCSSASPSRAAACSRYGRLPQTAGRISAGQLAERIPEANVPPELAELVAAFNAMLGRLEDSFQRLSDFSADLAHELRTPLHALRMQTEVSLAKPRSDDEYRDLLASNLEEYERLSRMIADMLFLAKADNGLVVPQREAVRLLDLGRQLFDYYGILAESQQLALDGEDLTVRGDRLMLQRAIGNLLVNAIQHTPARAGSPWRYAGRKMRQSSPSAIPARRFPPPPCAPLRALRPR